MSEFQQAREPTAGLRVAAMILAGLALLTRAFLPAALTGRVNLPGPILAFAAYGIPLSLGFAAIVVGVLAWRAARPPYRAIGAIAAGVGLCVVAPNLVPLISSTLP